MAETGQTPIFVINLDGAHQRLEKIERQLNGLGLTFERVPAVRGASMTEAEKRSLNPPRFWHGPHSDSELGCYASHLKVLRLIVERGLSCAIVLEDDAAFSPTFLPVTSVDFPLPDGTDTLKLEGFVSRRVLRGLPVAQVDGLTITFLLKPTAGSAAYLITQKGARTALAKLKRMKAQFDGDLFSYWRTGLRSYDALPYPVWQEGETTMLDRADRPAPGRVEKFAAKMLRSPLKEKARFHRLALFIWRNGLTAFKTGPVRLTA
jgi:glycosyl transferase family 25